MYDAYTCLCVCMICTLCLRGLSIRYACAYVMIGMCVRCVCDVKSVRVYVCLYVMYDTSAMRVCILMRVCTCVCCVCMYVCMVCMVCMV